MMLKEMNEKDVRRIVRGVMAEMGVTVESKRPAASVQEEKPEEEADTEQVMRTKIKEAMVELGVPAHVKGWDYIAEAIYLTMKEPEFKHNITKALYPAVAKKYGTTGSRVERAIRHAVELAFDRQDISVMEHWFGNTINPEKGKATNSEFICMVADTILNGRVLKVR